MNGPQLVDELEPFGDSSGSGMIGLTKATVTTPIETAHELSRAANIAKINFAAYGPNRVAEDSAHCGKYQQLPSGTR